MKPIEVKVEAKKPAEGNPKKNLAVQVDEENSESKKVKL
jgi:hypothetical protein